MSRANRKNTSAFDIFLSSGASKTVSHSSSTDEDSSEDTRENSLPSAATEKTQSFGNSSKSTVRSLDIGSDTFKVPELPKQSNGGATIKTNFVFPNSSSTVNDQGIFKVPDVPKKKGGIPISKSESTIQTGAGINKQNKKRRNSLNEQEIENLYPTLSVTPKTHSKLARSFFETLQKSPNSMSPRERKKRLGNTLCSLVARQEYEALELMLQQGADPNGSEQNPCTPLYVAVDLDLPKYCKLLLDYGASMVASNRLMNGATPVALAVTKNSIPVLNVLFSRVNRLQKSYTSQQQFESDADDQPALKKRKIN